MALQGGQAAHKLQPGGRQVEAPVPGGPEMHHGVAQFAVGFIEVEIEEGIQLAVVGAVFLWVDVPDEGLGCPLRADEGIFSPHDADVGRPEQFVEALLRDVRQGVDAQAAARGDLAGLQRHVQPGVDGRHHRAGADPECHRTLGSGHGVQPAIEPLTGIAEQQHGKRMVGRGRQAEGAQGDAFGRGLHLPVVALRDQVGFAQQTAGFVGEAGVVEILHQPTALRRRLEVMQVDPLFCAEVFEVQPDGLGRGLADLRNEGVAQVTAEHFDDHIARRGLGLPGPRHNLHPGQVLLRSTELNLRRNMGERLEVVQE